MRIALAPGDDVAAVVRQCDAASLVLVVMPGRTPLDDALWRAAIEPLAIELAPARRLNAVAAGAGATADAIDDAVTFLNDTRVITGQIIDVV